MGTNEYLGNVLIDAEVLHVPGMRAIEELRTLAFSVVEKRDDQNHLFIVDELNWPDVPMELRIWNHETMLKLVADAKNNPKDSFNQERATAAKSLYELIPRAETLHWYVILCKRHFTVVAWPECSLRSAGYSLAYAQELEEMINKAEIDGLPDTITPTVLHDTMKSLKGAMCTWDRERQAELKNAESNEQNLA